MHAELCFLNWFKEEFLEKTLEPGGIYCVTWYTSWSPCVECARQVAEFLNTHKYVRLRIVSCRLYYSNKPEHQQGLRNLAGAEATLAVMSPEGESSGSWGRGSSGDSTRMGAPRIPQEREWKGNLGI